MMIGITAILLVNVAFAYSTSVHARRIRPSGNTEIVLNLWIVWNIAFCCPLAIMLNSTLIGYYVFGLFF